MKYISRLLLAALLLPVFTSCEVEFSPNADWKSVPVVYCLLDQDDDTSWVRVERCYLSNDNIYSYGSNADSINYREGEISVAILAYEGGQLKDSIPFAYTLRQRDSGAFAGSMQPVYYCETSGRLKDNYVYYLRVRKADGTLLASSDAVQLIQYNRSNPIVKQLKNNKFGFYDVSGGTSGNCIIQWDLLPNARRYQPIVRFYYSVDDETRYVDVRCPSFAPTHLSTDGSIVYPRDMFLRDLKTMLLPDSASRKMYLKMVDIYLTCCTEDLHTYMSTVGSGNAIDQGRETHSNINGGIGVFAARRTHCYRRFNADESDRENEGLAYFLKNLGVNIYLP